MSEVDYGAVRMDGLKTAVRLLNESGLLDKPIPITGRTKKKQLTDAFIEALGQCDDKGVIEKVPDLVYEYFESIISDPNADKLDDAEEDDIEEDDEMESEPDPTITDPDVIAYLNKEDSAEEDTEEEEFDNEDFGLDSEGNELPDEDLPEDKPKDKKGASQKKKSTSNLTKYERKCKGFGLFKHLNTDIDQAELPIE